jgi:hypothetical protein
MRDVREAPARSAAQRKPAACAAGFVRPLCRRQQTRRVRSRPLRSPSINRMLLSGSSTPSRDGTQAMLFSCHLRALQAASSIYVAYEQQVQEDRGMPCVTRPADPAVHAPPNAASVKAAP